MGKITPFKINKEKFTIEYEHTFDAPAQRIWDVCSDPSLVPRWWGPRRLKTVVDKFDFRVGGAWRYIQTDNDGNSFAFNGVYKEIDEPRLISNTFEFEPMPGHILTETSIFEEVDGKTTMFVTVQYDSLEDLEGMVATGMEKGSRESHERLEALVSSL